MDDVLVLLDPAVKALLRSFNRDDIVSVKSALIQGLKDYSTKGTEAEPDKQPHRSVVSASTGQITLFMPAVAKEVVGSKMIGVPPPWSSTPSAASAGTKGTAPTGVLTLLNAAGKLIGVINAEEFTAFRTSLGSMILYPYRKETSNIVVFGAGKQAIWHIRLALMSMIFRSFRSSTKSTMNTSHKSLRGRRWRYRSCRLMWQWKWMLLR